MQNIEEVRGYLKTYLEESKMRFEKFGMLLTSLGIIVSNFMCGTLKGIYWLTIDKHNEGNKKGF